MTHEVITPAEAWEEVERRKIDVSYSPNGAKWYATIFRPIINVVSGPTPLDAVTNLLAMERIQPSLDKIPAMVDEMEAAR